MNCREKKDGSERRGFKIFKWKRDDSNNSKRIGGVGGESGNEGDKDNRLDQDINDLEKTFDSLGIVGQNKWSEDNKPRPLDDIENLEPMRNRKQVRVRAPRVVNGVAPTEGSGESSGSSSTKRTFRYSWEMSDVTPTQDDEWEYQAVRFYFYDKVYVSEKVE